MSRFPLCVTILCHIVEPARQSTLRGHQEKNGDGEQMAIYARLSPITLKYPKPINTLAITLNQAICRGWRAGSSSTLHHRTVMRLYSECHQ